MSIESQIRTKLVKRIEKLFISYINLDLIVDLIKVGRKRQNMVEACCYISSHLLLSLNSSSFAFRSHLFDH